jgi:hypothetical protein
VSRGHWRKAASWASDNEPEEEGSLSPVAGARRGGGGFRGHQPRKRLVQRYQGFSLVRAASSMGTTCGGNAVVAEAALQ